MEPVSLKSETAFNSTYAQTQVIKPPLKQQLKKETIILSKPVARATVYIKLPKKLSIEMNVHNRCCLIIGRAPSPPNNMLQYSLLALDNTQISRTHLALFMEKETLYVQDMNSSNGSYMTINGVRYALTPQQPTALADHSVVEFGEAVLNLKPSSINV